MEIGHARIDPGAAVLRAANSSSSRRAYGLINSDAWSGGVRPPLESDDIGIVLRRREQYEVRGLRNFRDRYWIAARVNIGVNAITDRRVCVARFRGGPLVERRLKTAPGREVFWVQL